MHKQILATAKELETDSQEQFNNDKAFFFDPEENPAAFFLTEFRPVQKTVLFSRRKLSATW